MILDNWRLLHGRHAYTGSRTMTSCFVSRGEIPIGALRQRLDGVIKMRFVQQIWSEVREHHTRIPNQSKNSPQLDLWCLRLMQLTPYRGLRLLKFQKCVSDGNTRISISSDCGHFKNQKRIKRFVQRFSHHQWNASADRGIPSLGDFSSSNRLLVNENQ